VAIESFSVMIVVSSGRLKHDEKKQRLLSQRRTSFDTFQDIVFNDNQDPHVLIDAVKNAVNEIVVSVKQGWHVHGR